MIKYLFEASLSSLFVGGLLRNFDAKSVNDATSDDELFVLGLQGRARFSLRAKTATFFSLKPKGMDLRGCETLT